MRAIFMIPTKPPPTFTHPEDYSDEMIDFVKKCLIKDPMKRSSATELLEHEWIKETCESFEANNGSSTLLAQLVEHSMDKIQAFREKEDEESGSGSDSSDDDEGEKSGSSKVDDGGGGGGLPPTSDDWDSGTMVMTQPKSSGGGLPPTSDDWDCGTMVMTKPKSSGGGLPPTSDDWDSGTMVMTKPKKSGGGLPPTSDDWDSGTMVMTKVAVRSSRGDYDEEDFDSGTMIMTGGGGGSSFADARERFNREQQEGKTADVTETAYGNYLSSKKKNLACLNKIDGMLLQITFLFLR
jgi:serine/threonine protein kinase